jgi:hypothetical protein
MKYRSDNKTIEEAFSKTWYISVCFFLVTFGLMILGLYLAGQHRLDWLFPTSIFGSLLVGGILTIKLCNYWFGNWVTKVDNPNELYRRATRLYMVSQSSAIKIAKKYNIDILNNNHSPAFVNLPDIKINKRVLLTKRSIKINNKEFYWTDIDNFEILPHYTGNRTFFGPTLDLILCFKTKTSKRFPLRFIKPNPFDFEYNIDKYLENSKKYNT